MMSWEEEVGLGMQGGRRGGAASFQWRALTQPRLLPPTQQVCQQPKQKSTRIPKVSNFPCPFWGQVCVCLMLVLVSGAVPWLPLCPCLPGSPQPGHPSLGYLRVSISEAWVRGPPQHPSCQLSPSLDISAPVPATKGCGSTQGRRGKPEVIALRTRAGLSRWGVGLSLGRSL